MKEAELTSDITVMMLNGYGGKSKKAIDDAYKKYDSQFSQGDVVARRFRRVLDSIAELLEPDLPKTPFHTENWFIPLYFVLYDRLWPDASLTKAKGAKPIPKSLRRRLLAAGRKLGKPDTLPQAVQNAISGAATDPARRNTRLDYLKQLVN